MDLFVSPTGNGVAIEFANDHLAFYTREGKQSCDSVPRVPVELAKDGDNVILCRIFPLRDSNGSMYLEKGRVFLPLGARVTEELSNQVIMYLRLDDERELAAMEHVETCIRDLTSLDEAVRKSARDGLVYYAHLSIPLPSCHHRRQDREVSRASSSTPGCGSMTSRRSTRSGSGCRKPSNGSGSIVRCFAGIPTESATRSRTRTDRTLPGCESPGMRKATRNPLILQHRLPNGGWIRQDAMQSLTRRCCFVAMGRMLQTKMRLDHEHNA